MRLSVLAASSNFDSITSQLNDSRVYFFASVWGNKSPRFSLPATAGPAKLGLHMGQAANALHSCKVVQTQSSGHAMQVEIEH